MDAEEEAPLWGWMDQDIVMGEDVLVRVVDAAAHDEPFEVLDSSSTRAGVNTSPLLWREGGRHPEIPSRHRVLCLQAHLNGRKVCTAAVPPGQLTSMRLIVTGADEGTDPSTAPRATPTAADPPAALDDGNVSVVGGPRGEDGPLSVWMDHDIVLGDELLVRVVLSADHDAPVDVDDLGWR